MKLFFRNLLLVAIGVAVTACGRMEGESKKEEPKNAAEFVDKVNSELRDLRKRSSRAQWVYNTYIMPDSQALASSATEAYLNWRSETIQASKKYDVAKLEGDTARAVKLLKQGATMPAPSEPEKINELANLSSELEGMYGSGKYCPQGKGGKCYELNDLESIIDHPADKSYDRLLWAWEGWRTVSPPMKKKYERFVELMNEGAGELGYDHVAELWKSGYDMEAKAFEQEVERLWSQVEPMYEELHCYVRDELRGKFGEDQVPADGPIPAHLLGNMWAQEWGNVYPIVRPYEGVSDIDVTAVLEDMQEQKAGELIAGAGDNSSARDIVEARRQAHEWTAKEMVRSAESFYTSLGLTELPDSFWENSLFIKPRDRSVVCHASAWDMDMEGDVRIKMCIEPNSEDLSTIYHELGHLYYDLAYNKQPPLFQTGAHDGFHEAIGDTIVLAMTPEYLKDQGLVQSTPEGRKAVINTQMKMALDKVAFLPFGKLIDQWRWKVFSGEVKPENYNEAWWDLREKYQGVAAPVERGDKAFDPGAKYHIPGNTPYTRYFLARVLQFQFYKAMCDAAGYQGPLHQCTFAGSEKAGKRFWAMMEKGASQPWQDTLEELTGSRKMDAQPMIEYFKPLRKWLDKQNEGRTCGWSPEADKKQDADKTGTSI